ncbi:MAG: SurA N-terminal domain-containing protein [Desulfobacteraceae bacterium]
MLSLMRKNAGRWLIKIVLFAIVIVFVFWGVGSMRSRNKTEVAEVNGEVIPVEVYRQTYYRMMDDLRRAYGGQVDDNMLKKMLNPGEMALDRLVERILLSQEAGRLKIEVDSDELAQAIYSMPVFQVDGAFNMRRYQQVLAQNNLSDQRFRMDRKEAMLLNKLRAILLVGVVASEDDARAWYDWKNTQVSIEYALFKPEQYGDLQPTDEQVRAYFDDHKDNYRTQPRIKATYVYFDPASMKSDVQISEEAIAAYYQEHKAEFRKEKRVKARHILFKVDKGADAARVEARKAEAMKVYQMAKAGKDFAGLAKKYSEGPSKDKGGELGWFTRSRMVKPFADKAFSMAAGEIGEPVRTDFGWHVIKVEQVEPATTQSLEQAAPSIRTRLTNEKAKKLAHEKADALYDSVFDGDDLLEAAKSQQAPVHQTDYFTAQGPKEKGIADKRKFTKIAFDLDKMAISEVQEFGDGYLILQVTDLKPAVIPEFEKVAQRVRADTIKDQQQQKAKADAEALLAELKNGGTIAQAGARFHVQPEQTPLFGRSGAIPTIGNEQQISQMAFGLTADKPLAENAVQGRKGWYAIRLKERKSPDEKGFAKERKMILKRLTEQKQKSAYQDWMADLRSRSKIKVNRSLLEK